MLDEYYDLQKNISELKKINLQESENLKKLLEASLFQIEKPIIKTNNLNNYLSNIKKQLIRKGYLDYINRPNYKLLEEIRKEICNEEYTNFTKFSNLISLDFEELKINFLKNDNLIFYNILKKMKENKYLIFLVNFDFLEKGIHINYQNIIDVYYEANQKKISEEEMKFQIENLKIKTQIKEDIIEGIHKKYDIFNEKEINYLKQITILVDELNKLKILAVEINLDDIIKNKSGYFIEGINKNKNELEGIISQFVYENEIQDFINEKSSLTQKINEISKEIFELNKHIIKKKKNLDNKKIELKEYDYLIREINNSYLTNKKDEINENNSENLKEKFYNTNHIEIIKIKNEIKKINIQIKEWEEKKNNIFKKMENYIEETKKNKIIKKRFQKIIEKYQNEIDNLNIKILNKEKIIEDKNNLGNTNTITKISIFQKEDKIQDLINKIKEEKIKKNKNIEEEIGITNSYNVEIKIKIKEKELGKVNLENKLKNINIKYSNKFLIYKDYQNKLKSLIESLDLLNHIKNWKNIFFQNQNDYKEEIEKFNINHRNLLNTIKNIEKNDKFWISIEKAINLIKLLYIFIENQKIYNLGEIETKKEFFYLNLLEYIDLKRINKNINKNNNYEGDFLKYNKNLYKDIWNKYQLEKLEEVSIDLKKMIYILQ